MEILARNSFTSRPVTDPPSHPCSTRGYIEGNKSVNSRRLKNKPSIYTSFRSSQREFLHSSLSLIFVSPISSTSLIPTLSSSRCATREQPINQGERVVRRYQNYSLTLFRYFLHWKILLSFRRVIFRNNKFHITIVSFSSIIKCLYIQYICT